MSQGICSLHPLVKTKEFIWYFSRPQSGGDARIHVLSCNIEVENLSLREFLSILDTLSVISYWSGSKKGMLMWFSDYDLIMADFSRLEISPIIDSI